jgi:hypothetical protein
VVRDRRQPGDTPLIIDDSPINGGGFGSGYYIHRTEHPNSPQLTQIQYYIVMKGNVKLYQRVSEEFRLGSNVLGSDYDAVTTEDYPRAPLIGGKIFHLKGHHRKAVRTVHNVSKEEIVPLVVVRRPEDNGKVDTDILRGRVGERLHGHASRAGDPGATWKSLDIHPDGRVAGTSVPEDSNQKTGGLQSVSTRGNETTKDENEVTHRRDSMDSSTPLIECPRCHSTEYVQRSVQNGFYCTVHPKAIMEMLLAG